MKEIKTMADWIGNQISSYVCNGASNHSDKERQNDDYYATDPDAVKELLKRETFSSEIWECAVGGGHIAQVLVDNGYSVQSSDIIDRGYPETKIVDFLEWNKANKDDIVTNPPYKYAKEFVNHALDISDDGVKVGMFLNLTFLEGQARKELFAKYPPKTVYVFSKRVKCAPNGDFGSISSSAVAYAWFVWEKGFSGNTEIKWI